MKTICTILLVLCAASAVASAEDLPQFKNPEQRVAWHVDRAKHFKKKRQYKEGYLEYLTLIVNGGGTSKIEKEAAKLQKKAGISDEDAQGYRETIKPSGPSAHLMREYKSKHYVLRSNLDEEHALEYMKRLEAFQSAYNEIWGKGLKAHGAKNLIVHVYRSRVDFHAYCGAQKEPTCGGFFNDGSKITFTFLDHTNEVALSTSWDTLLHEGTHQLSFMCANQSKEMVNLTHFWVSEATAIHMEGLVWDGEGYAWKGIAPSRAKAYRKMIEDKRTIPINEFLSIKHADFNLPAYNQASVMVAYLLETHPKKFMKYVKWCFSTKGRRKIEEKTFGKPLAEVLAGMNEWFAKLES